jgi:putative PIN family toxin of toxin-antitoxin system
MKIVLDTNVLLQIISSRSMHHWIWEALKKEQLVLCLTTDIILEYEEILIRKRHAELAQLILEILLLMPNIVRVEKYFSFGLPTRDPDDQKFLDCAIACGASYLVTEDNHFNEVKNKDLFEVKIVSPSEFLSVCKDLVGR